VLDTIMAFPLFVLAMGIVAAAGNSVQNVVIATAIINVPFYARVARAEVMVRRDLAWVQAARLAGNPGHRILFGRVLPNALPPMMVQISLNMGWAILNAAGLSFIGLGVQAPTAEWGIMVAEGAGFIVSGEWWLAMFPGAALMLAVFTFNLMGDGLPTAKDLSAWSPPHSRPCCAWTTSRSSSAPVAAPYTPCAACPSTCTRAAPWASWANPARASRSPPTR
jgi:peptide/nickel transport system permease protein